MLTKLDNVKKHASSLVHERAVEKHKKALFGGAIQGPTLEAIDRKVQQKTMLDKEKLVRILFFCLKKGRPISE